MLRVAVVALSPVVRAGLARIISDDGRFALGALAELPAGLGGLEGIGADVVVAEVDGAQGPWEVPAESAEAFPAVVALVQEWPGPWLAQLLAQHGGAVLSPDASAEALCAAIEAAGAGLVSIEQRAFARGARLHFDAEGANPGEPLTEREAEVLELLADGHSNKSIARVLKVSEHTAKFHVSAVLAKMGAATRTEAVSLGIRRGLVSL